MTVSRVPVRNTGLELSRIVAGCWRLIEWNKSLSDLDRWIQSSVDLGITSFDHADIYGGYRCEAEFGAALAPSLRNRIQLITKCGVGLVSPARPDHRVHHYDTSREHILASAEESLRNLRTDYIDLLLVHRPDPLLCADEVASAFDALHRTGKVLHFGVSNFLPWQFDLLEDRVSQPLVTNQLELSVGHLEPLHDGTLDQAQRLRLPPMAWSPLGGGALVTSEEPRWQRIRAVLGEVGRRHGDATLEQVAIAWLLRHPANVLPVVGTGRCSRLLSLCEAERIELSRQDWFEIWQASAGRGVP